MGTRPERVAEAIRQEVAKIVQYEIKDPRLGFITITGVDVSPDLRNARVFFTVLGDEKKKRRALYGLRSAKGYIKGRLGDLVKLRFMPDLDFKIDDSLERTQKVLGLMDKLHKEREERDDTGRRSGDTEV